MFGDLKHPDMDQKFFYTNKMLYISKRDFAFFAILATCLVAVNAKSGMPSTPFSKLANSLTLTTHRRLPGLAGDKPVAMEEHRAYFWESWFFERYGGAQDVGPGKNSSYWTECLAGAFKIVTGVLFIELWKLKGVDISAETLTGIPGAGEIPINSVLFDTKDTLIQQIENAMGTDETISASDIDLNEYIGNFNAFHHMALLSFFAGVIVFGCCKVVGLNEKMTWSLSLMMGVIGFLLYQGYKLEMEEVTGYLQRTLTEAGEAELTSDIITQLQDNADATSLDGFFTMNGWQGAAFGLSIAIMILIIWAFVRKFICVK